MRHPRSKRTHPRNTVWQEHGASPGPPPVAPAQTRSDLNFSGSDLVFPKSHLVFAKCRLFFRKAGLIFTTPPLTLQAAPNTLHIRRQGCRWGACAGRTEPHGPICINCAMPPPYGSAAYPPTPLFRLPEKRWKTRRYPPTLPLKTLRITPGKTSGRPAPHNSCPLPTLHTAFPPPDKALPTIGHGLFNGHCPTRPENPVFFHTLCITHPVTAGRRRINRKNRQAATTWKNHPLSVHNITAPPSANRPHHRFFHIFHLYSSSP